MAFEMVALCHFEYSDISPAGKNFNFKNSRRWTAAILKIEKLWYLCNTMTSLYEIWNYDAECVSQVPQLLKKLIFRVKDGRWTIHLRDLFWIITRYRNFSIFKMAAVHRREFLKLKLLPAGECLNIQSGKGPPFQKPLVIILPNKTTSVI